MIGLKVLLPLVFSFITLTSASEESKWLSMSIVECGFNDTIDSAILRLGARTVGELALMSDPEILQNFIDIMGRTYGPTNAIKVIDYLKKLRQSLGPISFPEFSYHARLGLWRLNVRTAEDFRAHERDIRKMVSISNNELAAWNLRQQISSAAIAERTLGRALSDAVLASEGVLALLENNDPATPPSSVYLRSTLDRLRRTNSELDACIGRLVGGSLEPKPPGSQRETL